MTVSGAEGYADEAEALLKQYESISFAEIHKPVSHLIPGSPSDIIDIGAGTGRDAAGFAGLGHRVVAAEPTEALRTRAMALHPSPRIEWIDDSLPDLASVVARRVTFDVVMLTAVWMHLDHEQRQRAMPEVASLPRPGGMMIMSLRYGPVPKTRRMFAVSVDETKQLAGMEGLHEVLRYDSPDGALRLPAVSWSRLAFSKDAAL